MLVILQLGPLLTRPPGASDDPLARLNRLGESWLSRCGRWLGQAVLASYALNAIICVSIAPLTAYSNNLIALAALIIGPPVVVVSSVALVAGFFLLMVGAAVPDLAWPLARLTEWCLGGCEAIVHAVVLVPWGVGRGADPAELVGRRGLRADRAAASLATIAASRSRANGGPGCVAGPGSLGDAVAGAEQR
jgi:hypothetical protein